MGSPLKLAGTSTASTIKPTGPELEELPLLSEKDPTDILEMLDVGNFKKSLLKFKCSIKPLRGIFANIESWRQAILKVGFNEDFENEVLEITYRDPDCGNPYDTYYNDEECIVFRRKEDIKISRVGIPDVLMEKEKLRIKMELFLEVMAEKVLETANGIDSKRKDAYKKLSKLISKTPTMLENEQMACGVNVMAYLESMRRILSREQPVPNEDKKVPPYEDEEGPY